MTSRELRLKRVFHVAASVGQKLRVWGGNDYSDSYRVPTTAVESFDVSSESWLESQQLLGSLPDYFQGMAITQVDETAYTFGGEAWTGRDFAYFNKLFEINLSTLQCREIVPEPHSHVPMKVSFSGMVYFDHMLVVHGGMCQYRNVLTDKVHVFDLQTRVWSVQPTTGKKPPAMSHHTFTKIDDHRAVVIAGGVGWTPVNDIYVLDMQTWHWSKPKISGEKPSPRYSHTTCYIAGPLTGQQYPLLMVVGGHGDQGALSDVWLLDVDKWLWSEMIRPDYITPRKQHSACVFGSGPSFRLVVLFGGCNEKNKSFAETTLLILELSRSSWQVTKVVKPDELGKPDERLREQMEKLELCPHEETGGGHKTQDTTTEHAAHTATSSPPHMGGEAMMGPIIDIKEVHMDKLLGEGGFGAVYEAKWKKKKVAVKVCPGNLIDNLSREIEILSSLPPHPNVITFFGVALSSDAISTCIITELAPNGSLYNYLHAKKEEPSLDQSLAWVQQVALGMQHLHNNNVVHRDLKSGNILLSLGLLVKVCDFGTARTLAKTAKTTQKGTYRWMAPEIMEGVEASITKMCDVYSFGMVMYEIFSHKIPYADIPTDAKVGMAVLQGKLPSIPATLPPFLQPLLEACWKKEPNQRPQFNAIILAIQTESYE